MNFNTFLFLKKLFRIGIVLHSKESIWKRDWLPLEAFFRNLIIECDTMQFCMTSIVPNIDANIIAL